MPKNYSARLGRALLLGAIALSATAASAASDQQVVTAQHTQDLRSVSVRVADLNLDRAQDRNLLAIRVDNAARSVCDVNEGSKLDKLPRAQACLAQARSGALAQLGVRGQTASAVLATLAMN